MIDDMFGQGTTAPTGVTTWVRPGRVSRRRLIFSILLALYIALTVAVVVGSPLDAVDRWIRVLPMDRRAPGWRRFVLDYVMFGQRGPSTAVALVWIGWLCHARRTLDPLIRFGTALLLLNLSVGVVKLGTGRWGPHATAHAHDVFAGGDIFPSGHTSNAVVLFGVLAMLATRHRTAMTVLAGWISLTVGLSTLYLDTHWVTDVLGGWLAGGLVLLIVPRCTELIETRLQHSHRFFRGRLTRFHYLPRNAQPRVPAAPAGSDRGQSSGPAPPAADRTDASAQSTLSRRA